MSKYKYSKRSEAELSSMDPRLASVFRKAIDYGIIDVIVIEGHRNKSKQNRFFNLGKSKVKYPDGKHNTVPSKAGDVAPYVNGAISWDWKHCLVLAGIVLAAAAELKVIMRWGGNWDMDGEPVTDQNFQDLCHFEIVE